jgi:hypothetical protein
LKRPLKILFFLIVTFSTNAQHLTHDVGVFIGTATIQTDYGQRANFLSSFGNSVFSLSLVHYLQFFNIDTRWNSEDDIANHIMVKSELSFSTKETFKHHGEYTIGDGLLAQQLRGMTGTITMISAGISAEYYFKDLKEFMFPYSDIKWNPYLNLGLRHSFYTNTLNSTLGDWQTDKTILPLKYRADGQLDVGSGSAFSMSIGFGTRYKLSEKFDLAASFNWEYFFSDSIDGLQADHGSNKNNEFLIQLQVGIIYHLNFAGGIFCKK